MAPVLWQAAQMRTVYETRRENLRTIAKQWGGPTSLARKLGHANGSYLAQLIGPNPSREVSEKVAREIEAKLGLPTGWLDQENPGTAQPNDEQLAQCVMAVASCLRDKGLRPNPETYSQLVALVYDRVRLTGRVDEAYTQKLVGLLAGGR
jgi:hypothetical protein